MNKTSPKQWTETPAEAIARLNQPMERKPRSNRVRKAIGAGLLAATVAAVGVPALDVLGDKAVQSVEADTHRPTEAQKQAMQRGLDAQTTTTEAPQDKPEVHHFNKAIAWNIVEHHLVDDDGQPINGDIRPLVDEIQAQADPVRGIENQDIVLPQGTHYTEFDTHPNPQDTPN